MEVALHSHFPDITTIGGCHSSASVKFAGSFALLQCLGRNCPGPLPLGVIGWKHPPMLAEKKVDPCLMIALDLYPRSYFG